MFRLRPATAAGDVEEAVLREITNRIAHFGRRLCIVSEFVRQTRVRIADSRNVCKLRHFGEIGPNLRRTEPTV